MGCQGRVLWDPRAAGPLELAALPMTTASTVALCSRAISQLASTSLITCGFMPASAGSALAAKKTVAWCLEARAPRNWGN